MNLQSAHALAYCLACCVPPADQRATLYSSGHPRCCDLCNSPLDSSDFFADAEVPEAGRWGYLCQDCIAGRQVRFGWGVGQLYQKTSDQPPRWLLVAGHPDIALDSDN